MELKFYNLMYVDLEEKRYLSGKTYNNEERIDLYVKGSCVLDKSLRIISLGGGKYYYKQQNSNIKFST